MPGLGPGNHDFAGAILHVPSEVVDGRAKPGQDGGEMLV